jgi:hypothetical protein
MYHVKVFYPGYSFGRGDERVIACVIYSHQNRAVAERVLDHCRRANSKALFFIHVQEGN